MNTMELRSLVSGRAGGTPTGRIVRALSARGSLSAAQIARLTGLAKSTVSMALAELRRADVVIEIGSDAAGSVGRPATTLSLNPEAGTCIGLLIGQSEIQVIVADVAHNVLTDTSLNLERDYDPEHAIRLIRELISDAYAEQWRSQAGLLGVGIAVGGPVSNSSGEVMRGGIPRWTGINLQEVFGPIFDAPVFIDNESNCSAIAEMTWGAAQGFDDFVVFTLDLGVGGAIVSGGKVLRGIAGGGGEFGHVVLDPDGPLCRCGNHGCLEVYASFIEPLDEARRHFGQPGLRISDVVQMALDGDELCRGLIKDAGYAGGRGLGLIGSVFNPPLIVVSGRLAPAGDILMGPLSEAFERYSLVKSGDVGEETRTILRPSQFTDNGGCMGAVGLVLRNHGGPLH